MNAISLFDSLFNDHFENGYNGFTGKTFYAPKVDVTETTGAYSLEMELPGLTQDDINIELDGSKLTISSKEKTETSENAENAEEQTEKPKYLIRERRQFNFSRAFTLPEDVDSEKVSASFKNGILVVTLPRKEVALPKRIQIDVA